MMLSSCELVKNVHFSEVLYITYQDELNSECSRDSLFLNFMACEFFPCCFVTYDPEKTLLLEFDEVA